MNYSWASG